MFFYYSTLIYLQCIYINLRDRPHLMSARRGGKGALTHSDFFLIFDQVQSRFSDAMRSNKSFQGNKNEIEIAETAYSV